MPKVAKVKLARKAPVPITNESKRTRTKDTQRTPSDGQRRKRPDNEKGGLVSFRVPDGITIISPSSPIHPWHNPPQGIRFGDLIYPNLAYLIYASLLNAIANEIYRDNFPRATCLRDVASSLSTTATLASDSAAETDKSWGKPTFLDKKLAQINLVEQAHGESRLEGIVTEICGQLYAENESLRVALCATAKDRIIIRMPGGRTTDLGGRLNRVYVAEVTQLSLVSPLHELVWDTDKLFVGNNILGNAWARSRDRMSTLSLV